MRTTSQFVLCPSRWLVLLTHLQRECDAVGGVGLHQVRAQLQDRLPVTSVGAVLTRTTPAHPHRKDMHPPQLVSQSVSPIHPWWLVVTSRDCWLVVLCLADGRTDRGVDGEQVGGDGGGRRPVVGPHHGPEVVHGQAARPARACKAHTAPHQPSHSQQQQQARSAAVREQWGKEEEVRRVGPT